MATSMATEFSTAASYFVLFSKKNEQQQSATTTSSESNSSSKFGPSSSQEDGNWEVYHWTEQDEVEAKATLEAHLEKSAISSLEKFQEDDADAEAWDKFYHDNGTRFFKDRHYFQKAFPNEFGSAPPNSKTLVEVGCGVGNACLPLLEDGDSSPWKTIHAMDISAEAIALLRQDPRFLECNSSTNKTGRSIHGHVCDISRSFPEVCVGVADVTTLIFCLSALDPDDMTQAAAHVASSLKPGGTLIVRDYGRYDEAQMKLGTSRNKRIKDNFYRKHDGTKCYYFALEDLEQLFVKAGLQVLELYFIRRLYGNKASGESRRRIWVQGRFVKPTE